MKPKLTLLFCLFLWLDLGQSVSAQISRDLAKETKIEKFYRCHLRTILAKNPGTLLQASKTTGPNERLVAWSYYDQTSFPGQRFMSDSFFLKYSGSNASSFDLNSFAIYDYFNPIDIGQHSNDFSDPGVMYDSLYSYHTPDNTTPLFLKEIATKTFTSAGRINTFCESQYGGAQTPSSIDLMRWYYNTSGVMTNVMSFANAAQDTFDKLERHFNAQNQPLVDSIFVYSSPGWQVLQTIGYTYDAAGNLTSLHLSMDNGMGWTTTSQYEYTYYSNSFLKTSVMFQNVNGSLLPFILDTFEYANTNSPLWTTLREQQNIPGVGNFTMRFERTMNAQNLPDTLSIFDVGGGNLLVEKDVWEYSTYGSPTRRAYWIPNPSNVLELGYEDFYYYELYYPTRLPSISDNSSSIKVYPNPATDVLSLQWENDKNNASSVRIFNLSGQLVQEQRLSRAGTNEKISIQWLAPGTYIISVTDKFGKPLLNQQFLKR